MISLSCKQPTGKPAKRVQPKLNLFLTMCQNIAAFMAENDGASFKAFVARADGGSLSLYVVTDHQAYDFDLSRKLAEFAGPYIERGLLESATLLPESSPEELSALFDPNSAFRIETKNA